MIIFLLKSGVIMHAFLKTGTLGQSSKEKTDVQASTSKDAKSRKKHTPWVEK